jgi:hypothetical protein
VYVHCRLSRGSAKDLKAAAALLLVPWYAFRECATWKWKWQSQATPNNDIVPAKVILASVSFPDTPFRRDTMSNIRFLTPSARWARTMLFMSSVRPRWCTRGLHNRRALLYKLEDGLGDFLPPPALKSIAVDWQQGLLERLNDEVKGTSHAVFQSVLLPTNN